VSRALKDYFVIYLPKAIVAGDFFWVQEEDQPYTNHAIPCKEGDLIYTFSDGFPDQFGGPKRKKYKYAQLKANLLEIAHLPMQDQKRELIKAFDDWKGDFEQIDDVCIIGFRVGS